MSTISLYIPRMSTDYNEDRVRAVFDSLVIGSVTRVDFASITPGNYTTPNDRFQKAFVHLSHFYDTDAANHLRDSLKTTNDSVRLQPDMFNQKVYWIVLLNKNPVADTNLNIHQVVENHRILEQLVFQQAEEIRNLQNTLTQLLTFRNFPEEIGEVNENEYQDITHLISVEDLDNSD